MKRDNISIPAQLAHLGGLWAGEGLIVVKLGEGEYTVEEVNRRINKATRDALNAQPWLYQDYSKRIGV